MTAFISVKEAAKLLGISKVAVIKQIQTGKIKASKVGNSYIINRNEITVINDKDVSEQQQAEIETAIDKTINEYGEALSLLKDS